MKRWRRSLYILIALICICCKSIETKAAYAENIGIIVQDTQMYTAASANAVYLGNIEKGNKVDIVSVLSSYVLINYNNQYAYIPISSICSDSDYTHLGERMPYTSPYTFIITEGNLYKKTVDNVMQSYQAIPEKIRNAFEDGGYKIKITEWDITEEAYAPYGGYHGTARIQAVFDYEKKILFINDEYPNTVIHEMGHFVNDFLSMYSSRLENKKILCSEAKKISCYAETNDKEFFAESFRLYIAEPQLLKNISPSTYNMIDTAIQLFPE